MKALRGNLERTENEYLDKKRSSEELLTGGGNEAQEKEKALIEMATAFCDQLRSKKELSDLFRRLEQDG